MHILLGKAAFGKGAYDAAFPCGAGAGGVLGIVVGIAALDNSVKTLFLRRFFYAAVKRAAAVIAAAGQIVPQPLHRKNIRCNGNMRRLQSGGIGAGIVLFPNGMNGRDICYCRSAGAHGGGSPKQQTAVQPAGVGYGKRLGFLKKEHKAIHILHNSYPFRGICAGRHAHLAAL